MARLVISEEVRNLDSFVPEQIFAFGSIVLHADPTGRLGRVGSFAPDQEVRFGNLEFSVDPRGDLLLTGLAVSSDTPEDSEALTLDVAFDLAHGANPDDDLDFNPDPAIAPDGRASTPTEYTSCADAPEVNSKRAEQIDPIELSTLDEALDRISSMKITDDPTPIHTQIGLEAGQEEFFVPPTTHFVATIEDLTDMLDYASEEAEDMDEEDRVPTPVHTG